MAFTSGSAVARAQVFNGSASTTLTTGSFTPTAGEMLYIWVFSFILFGGPTVPTLSGTGGMSSATFTEVVTGTFTLTVRCTLFRAVVPSGTSSTITATWGANQTSRGITVVEVAGADTGGTNGSNSIVQTTGLDTATGTTIAPTGLAAFAAGSGTLLFSMLTSSASDNSTPEASWTELYDINTNQMAAYWYEADDTTPTHTNSSSRQYMAIGIEIALAPAVSTTRRYSLTLTGVG